MRRLARKKVIIPIVAVIVILAVALLAVGWIFSNQIEDGGFRVKHEPEKYEVEVTSLGEGTVGLRSTTGADLEKEPKVVGLEWPSGYAQAGRVLERDEDVFVRELTPLEGDLAVGNLVRFDKFAFPHDPLRAHGIDYDEVQFTSPVGALDAWRFAGDDDTWVIFVHGHRSNRGEALRLLPLVTEMSFPALSITYRNDEGAPVDPSGYHRFGFTECEDLEGAVQLALDEGASDLVLMGHSFGGGIIASFLYRSALSDRVVGAILDSPMLDLGAATDLAARKKRLPVFVSALAKWIAGWRFGIDWRALNYLDRADELSAPLLLLHGDADESIPISVSERLARQRPDIVSLVKFIGSPHVGGWNSSRESYEGEVREFLTRVAK